MRKKSLVLTLLLLMAAGAAQAATNAWVLGNNPAAAAYAPTPSRAYNPSGGPIAINRVGVGVYNIRFVGLVPLANTGGAPFAGNVQVTTLGAPGACSVTNWGAAGLDVVIPIQCRNAAGAAADMQYLLLYTFN